MTYNLLSGTLCLYTITAISLHCTPTLRLDVMTAAAVNFKCLDTSSCPVLMKFSHTYYEASRHRTLAATAAVDRQKLVSVIC